MLFQTWQYLILLIVAVIGVCYIPNIPLKKVLILLLSMIFYAYGGGWQTLLFVAVIVGGYVSGWLIEKRKSKLLLGCLVAALFLPLVLYKYVPFWLSQFAPAYGKTYAGMFVLPIGISFYTFQAVGYVIDVYREGVRAERNLLNFACFISFFPQLVAGPIERCGNIMEQIRRMQKPEDAMMSQGFRHILLGLCLKLLVAETMANFVDPIYNDLADKGGLAVLIATLCFGVQIYCDFNGYTQIAIGSAKLLGIRLMQNFDHPYRANSMTDFWRRWHISLSSWFRDYLYIPLGGSKKGNLRTTVNSVVTFLVSGIWHGANWTFALWGLANGAAVAAEKYYYQKIKKQKFVSACYGVIVFFVINLFWVLFRANSIHDALLCYKLIFTDTIPQMLSLNSLGAIKNFLLRDNNWSSASLFPAVASIGIYLWYEWGSKTAMGLEKCLFSQKTVLRWTVYILLMLVTLYFGKTLAQSDFVYFRF